MLINGQWRLTRIDNLGGDPTNSYPNTVHAPATGGTHTPMSCPSRLRPIHVLREPNRQSPLVGRIYPGEAMTLVDGPRYAQQSVWWYVQADTGVMGWTAEGQPGEYWLAPVVSVPPTGQPQVGPITFCATVDRADRYPAPTTQFPDRVEAY